MFTFEHGKQDTNIWFVFAPSRIGAFFYGTEMR
jgi:hypothetical protein